MLPVYQFTIKFLFLTDPNKALVVVRNEVPFHELSVDVKGMTRRHFGRALREVSDELFKIVIFS